MKRLALLVLLVTIGCGSGASGDGGSGSLKYFGYVRTGDLVDSINATKDFTNIASQSAPCPACLTAMRAGGVMVVPELTHVLWEGPQGHVHLKADYVAQWNAFRAAAQLDANVDLLLAFYVADDPNWNGISTAELDTACQLVKATYPSAKIAVAENNLNVGSVTVPQSVDWVGFNYYGVLNPNTDGSWLAAYTTLTLKRSRPDQLMFLVMDGWWSQNPHGDAGIGPNQMGIVAENYYDFAKAHPEVVAMVTFIWPAFPGAPAGTLTSINEPVWVAAHRCIGKDVTGK